MEIRGQIALHSFRFQRLQLRNLRVLGGAQQRARDRDLSRGEHALLLLRGAILTTGRLWRFLLQAAAEGVDAADVVGGSGVGARGTGGRVAEEEMDGVGIAVEGVP